MRIIKVVLISKGSKRGYPYSVWRVVECEEGQQGYRSERGVRVLWESDTLYRPHAKRSDSQGFKARQEAEQVASQAREEQARKELARRALAIGLTPDAPEFAVRDREEELHSVS